MVSTHARRSLFLPFVLALAILLVGAFVMQIRFLPILESGEDGFQSELIYILMALTQGEILEKIADSFLALVHLIRLIAVSPFLAMEVVLGPAGQLGLLLLALAPLAVLPYRRGSSMLFLVPFLLPLAVSGRGALVAVGVGYIVLYMQSGKKHTVLLWLGVLWVILSSASVLMALLLLLFSAPPLLERRYGTQRWIAILVLGLLFSASAIDKLAGFQAGDTGYAAHAFESDNVLFILLSRTTLLASFAEGQYVRGVAYLIVTVYFGWKALMLLFSSRPNGMRRVVFCCLPGIALEGLGLLGLVLPLLWVYLEFDPSRDLLNVEKGVK